MARELEMGKLAPEEGFSQLMSLISRKQRMSIPPLASGYGLGLEAKMYTFYRRKSLEYCLFF